MLNYISFLDSFFEQIEKIGLDIHGLPLDHIAYQASSSDDYNQLKPQFTQFGQEVGEEVIGGRRVSIFKLDNPLKYKNYSIQALELIEPKLGQKTSSALEHAEFIITKPFDYYIEQYPGINWDKSSLDRLEFAHLKIHFDNGLTLKFLRKPILELVTIK